MAINLKRRITPFNHSYGNRPRYIVIHETGNHNDTAWGNANYFNGGNRGASAHYFVDHNETYQIVEDWNGAWHVGDGGGKFGISNFNSIGIEMCKYNGTVHTNTVNRAIELTAHLMKKHNIPLDRVVRHYDASRKTCPYIWSGNNWSRWWIFKEQLKKYINGEGVKMTEQEIVKIVDMRFAELNKKPSERGLGEDKDHWAYGKVVDLNKWFTDNQQDVPEKERVGISELRLDDPITRGEFFRVMADVLKLSEQ